MKITIRVVTVGNLDSEPDAGEALENMLHGLHWVLDVAELGKHIEHKQSVSIMAEREIAALDSVIKEISNASLTGKAKEAAIAVLMLRQQSFRDQLKEIQNRSG